MLEVLQQLTDNQLAILGCLGALGASGLLMTISFHGNPANRTQTPRTVEVKVKEEKQQSQRRAA